MMLIKIHRGDDVYEMHEGVRVSFLGQGRAIEIPAEEDHEFSMADRFPVGQNFTHVVYTTPPIEPKDTANHPRIRLVRWVEWYHPERDEKHLLVTDGEVYLCNDRGDTIEALR